MKKTILTAIIVIGFGGALVMGFLAWRNSNPGSDTAPLVNTNGANLPGVTNTGGPGGSPISAILPEGTSLEFGKVKLYNDSGFLFPYPKVSPSEIGRNLIDIVD